MSDFTTEIRLRVAEAQRSLVEARESGDDYLVQLSLGEIESLARVAADHQVTLDGVEESLAAHGLRTPGAGLPRMLDLERARMHLSEADLSQAETPNTLESAG
jgi:hypothetical protein